MCPLNIHDFQKSVTLHGSFINYIGIEPSIHMHIKLAVFPQPACEALGITQRRGVFVFSFGYLRPYAFEYQLDELTHKLRYAQILYTDPIDDGFSYGRIGMRLEIMAMDLEYSFDECFHVDVYTPRVLEWHGSG